MEHTDSTFGTTLAFGKIMSYLCSVKDVNILTSSPRLLTLKTLTIYGNQGKSS